MESCRFVFIPGFDPVALIHRRLSIFITGVSIETVASVFRIFSQTHLTPCKSLYENDLQLNWLNISRNGTVSAYGSCSSNKKLTETTEKETRPCPRLECTS
jgi:hypothetical protein